MKPKFDAPLYVAWEVTLQCNARCLHCYSDSGPGVQHPQQLSTDEGLRIIDQLAEAGLLILAFSGGEPLIRQDIFKLIGRAVENALVVNRFTTCLGAGRRISLHNLRLAPGGRTSFFGLGQL